MKILVETLFDCSATGTTGNFRTSILPYRDRVGNEIQDIKSWTRSRNQQRNWETLMQLMGLRCQIDNVESPTCNQDRWFFSFEIENPETFGSNGNLNLLYKDCEGVPMIQAQEAKYAGPSVLVTTGVDQNIWFKAINN